MLLLSKGLFHRCGALRCVALPCSAARCRTALHDNTTHRTASDVNERFCKRWVRSSDAADETSSVKIKDIQTTVKSFCIRIQASHTDRKYSASPNIADVRYKIRKKNCSRSMVEVRPTALSRDHEHWTLPLAMPCASPR